MGLTTLKIEIAKMVDPKKTETIEALVDPGFSNKVNLIDQ